MNITKYLFGGLDSNVSKIEKAFNVQISDREGINIFGNDEDVLKAKKAIDKITALLEKGKEITEQEVNYIIASIGEEYFENIEKLDDTYLCLTISGKKVAPKTHNQKIYVENMARDAVTFGIGPAGTGKTYLAMAKAITEFKKGNVQKIILTRPAIEAGENLGFLPGDLQQKIDPYLRPLYDALHEIMGLEATARNQEKGLIEVAPLAYMRGRTLNNAFIILDEAQNTTRAQMKMFLTRIGFNSKAIITGDVTQIDLPSNTKSGLVEAIEILSDVEGISIMEFSKKDVVRHPLVQRIIAAYEKSEKKVKYTEKVIQQKKQQIRHDRRKVR
ncbi:MAG: PhoH family protein [Defluviitaleaceae bacterium]|nr:PhoH family protein [Defluviitaleaceae bacterium]